MYTETINIMLRSNKIACQRIYREIPAWGKDFTQSSISAQLRQCNFFLYLWPLLFSNNPTHLQKNQNVHLPVCISFCPAFVY